MNMGDDAAISSSEEQDSLEDISYIGPTYADALRGLGVQRFSDLARYTPEELSELLGKKAGKNVSPGKIEKERWIEQARDKSHQKTPENMPHEKGTARPQKASSNPGIGPKTSKNTPHEKGAAQPQKVSSNPGTDPETSENIPDEKPEAQPQKVPNIPGRGQNEFTFTVTFRCVTDEQGSQAWEVAGYDAIGPAEFKSFETYRDFETIESTKWADWILDRMRRHTGVEPRTTEIEMAAEPSRHAQMPSGGEGMDEITLKRGGRDVTFKKKLDRFAVRPSQGRVSSEKALEASLGPTRVQVTHLNRVGPEKMDIFRIQATDEMEKTVDELRESAGADVVSHVYALGDAPESEVVPTGTMTIQFKPDVSRERREEILAEFGLAVTDDLDYLPDAYSVRLTDASKENPLKIGAKLQQREEIEVAEPDLAFRVSLQYAPTDTLYPLQWHLNNRGDDLGLVAGADVKAENAWNYTRGSRDITMCVIDDGFDLGHPEFDCADKIVAPADFGQDDLDPNPVFVDDNHGTACAGVALAEENGKGVVGLAPACSFMPIRMSPWLTDDTIVSYFRHAMEHGADVISCSWKARDPEYPLGIKVSGIIHHSATQGRHNKKGCVILFAAGNDYAPLDGVKDGQVYYQGFALHPDVIAVAASNSRDQHSDYSNYGPRITICAPSDGSPAGRGIVTTDRRGLAGYTTDDYTKSFGGTSSATPLAAGLAALILSVNRELTSAQVRDIMKETADKIDKTNGKYVNGHSPYFGHGRIDAHKAVVRAIELRERPPATEREEGMTIEISPIGLSLEKPTSPTGRSSLVADIAFQALGAPAEKLAANQIPFEIQVQTINRDDSSSRVVASDSARMRPATLTYPSKLRFPLPSPGAYTLQTDVIFHLPAGEMRTSRAGPEFKVESG